jgi:hypothetical protein
LTAGDLFVASSGNSVSEFEGLPDTIVNVATIGGSLTGLNGPTGLALDPAGDLYVSNFYAHTMTEYAAGTRGNEAPVATVESSGDATAVALLPPPTVPGAPVIRTATAGNASATVTFTPPSSDGGSPVTGYDVYKGTTRKGEGATPVNPRPLTATSYTITGLRNGVTYYFVVKAINAAGASPASNEASATPKAP